MSLRDYFRRRYEPKKSLKERVKDLEDTVEKLEQASFITVEVGKPSSFFDKTKWVGISTVLKELVEALGYELVYRDKVRTSSCIRKKISKK